MQRHYQPYPIADKHQHSGLGIIPESIQAPKTNPTYAPASDASASMLMLEGTHNDRICTSDSSGRRLLLHQDFGQYGLLRAQAGFQGQAGDEGIAVCELHAGSDGRQERRRHERGAYRRIVSRCFVFLRLAAVSISLWVLFIEAIFKVVKW